MIDKFDYRLNQDELTKYIHQAIISMKDRMIDAKVQSDKYPECVIKATKYSECVKEYSALCALYDYTAHIIFNMLKKDLDIIDDDISNVDELLDKKNIPKKPN